MDKWFYRTSIILAVLGLLDSIYMTIFKLTNNANMCVGSHACETVNSSPYAEIHGIPVAVIGIVGYLSIAVALLLESRSSFFQENGTMLIFGLALIGFLFTLYLIYVETALIHAFCPFCITSQVVMTTLFILSVIRLVRQPTN